VVSIDKKYRVVRTLISKRPRENSFLVALIGTLLMFVVSLYAWQDDGSFMNALKGDSDAVLGEGQVYRLFTAILIHAHLKHLISNAIFFLFFSYLLYGYYGFWVYPILCFLMGGAVNYLTLLTYPEGISIIGASGVVYLMAGFWFAGYMYIERSRPVSRRILHVLGVSLLLLIPSAVNPEVSYSSHFIGFLLGITSGIVYLIRNRDEIRDKEVRVFDEEGEAYTHGFENRESHAGNSEDDDDPWVM